MTEKFNVVWIWNNKTYNRICDDLSQAIMIRDRILTKKDWSYDDVSIHLIQVDKFGDKVII